MQVKLEDKNRQTLEKIMSIMVLTVNNPALKNQFNHLLCSIDLMDEAEAHPRNT